jgi:hypothetical protein
MSPTFSDRSTASDLEKAKRVLQGLMSGSPSYFFEDGYPRTADIASDALAVLATIESIEPIMSIEARLQPAQAEGVAVIADGVVVAWFAVFDDEAQEWCSYNYCGRWLTRKASPPQILPFTSEEIASIKACAEQISLLFKVP